MGEYMSKTNVFGDIIRQEFKIMPSVTLILSRLGNTYKL